MNACLALTLPALEVRGGFFHLEVRKKSNLFWGALTLPCARQHMTDTTPRQGSDVYSLREGKVVHLPQRGLPRGRSGGRKPKTPDARKAEAHRVDALRRRLSDPGVIETREKVKAKNLKRGRELQAAIDYKGEHNVGKRVKVVYVEKVVYVQQRAIPSISRETEDALNVNVDLYMSEDEQDWLSNLVRTEGATKDGTLFMHDFISRFQVQFHRKLSDYTMRRCLMGLGFSYEKLRSKYYKAGSEDVKNLKRRDRIIPVLHYLHRYSGNVCVWSFDESSFYVQDFSKFAWVDTSERDGNMRKHLPAGDQKGERVNVSAFFSEKLGVLYDDELQHHVGALNRDKNDADATAEVFRWFSRVAKQKHPEFLHVVCTDSPAIHTGLAPGSCDPSKINMGDGGVNRSEDLLYGSSGMSSIFRNDPVLSQMDTRNFKLKDFRKTLWNHDPVKAQLLILEKILDESGHLLFFHPVAHPQLAPIELLWRDMKFDYRVNWTHTRKNLIECITGWLSRSADEEFMAICRRSFQTAQAFIAYYLSGGVEKIPERKAKLGAASFFDHLDDAQNVRRRNMQEYLYSAVNGIPKTSVEQKRFPLERLRERLKGRLHMLNWLRKKHSEINAAE